PGQYLRPQVGDLLVGHVVQVELGKAVARGQVVADYERCRGRIGNGARLHDQLKGLYPSDITARVGVQYAGIDDLWVGGVLERRGVHDGVCLARRVHGVDVEAHLEGRPRLPPQYLIYLGLQVEHRYLAAVQRTADQGRYHRGIVRQRVHYQFQLHDLEAQ